MFDLDSINSANNKQTVFPVKTSISKYHADLENSFQVLEDGISIVGVGGPARNQLFLEKIGSRDSSYTFGKHQSTIHSVVYDNKSRILAGDKSSTLVEYAFDQLNKVWLQKQRFSSLGVGDVLSIAVLDQVAVVGGNNMHVRIIDLSRNELVGSAINTSIGVICSLVLFYDQKIQMMLSVTGHSINASLPMNNLITVSEYMSKGSSQMTQVKDKDNQKVEWYKNQLEQSKEIQEKQARKIEKLKAKLRENKLDNLKLYQQIATLGGSPSKTMLHLKETREKTDTFIKSIRSLHNSYKKAIAKIKHLDRESLKIKNQIRKLTLNLHNAVDRVKQEVSESFKKDLQIKRLLRICKSRGFRKCICDPGQITKIDDKRNKKSKQLVKEMPKEFHNLKQFYDFDLKLLYLDCLSKLNQSRQKYKHKKSKQRTD